MDLDLSTLGKIVDTVEGMDCEQVLVHYRESEKLLQNLYDSEKQWGSNYYSEYEEYFKRYLDCIQETIISIEDKIKELKSKYWFEGDRNRELE